MNRIRLRNGKLPCFLHFIKTLQPEQISASNLKIEGGERITGIQVVSVTPGPDASFPLSPQEGEEKVLVIKVSEAGDFSTYTLRLVRADGDPKAPDGFDPALSAVDFSFKVNCPSDFDCKPDCTCSPDSTAPAGINYLAKDYAGFRQLMLDRISLLSPDWTERNPADLGITLVELLAYVGDHLSYRQDAIASEAYLATSRKRISVKRHARMVDYFMHDGCNARTWLHINVPTDIKQLSLERGKGDRITKVLTRTEGLPTVLNLDSADYEKAVDEGAKVFELMHDVMLYPEHNEMKFYTWGGEKCCLPSGATEATLSGNLVNLRVGDVLILAEVLGAKTGMPQDADPAHRHAVRLTEVSDPCLLPYQLLPEFSAEASEEKYVTDVKWSIADALPFSLCISGNNGAVVGIVLGNNVLVDHGLTILDKEKSSLFPDAVPRATLVYADPDCGCNSCEKTEPAPLIPRYAPVLTKGPLTFTVPFNLNGPFIPAAAMIKWSAREVLPAIKLVESDYSGKPGPVWEPQQDLLDSEANAKEFVVETETDGTPQIRFGNGIQGARPAQETKFAACYRIGNGTAGNVGAGSLVHIVTGDTNFTESMKGAVAMWNPLPARGGREPETMEEAKQFAPVAFRRQQRAVTLADYELFAKQSDQTIQRATATMRWTGSWRTVFYPLTGSTTSL